MTVQSIASAGSDAGSRVRAVRRQYARRGGRGTVRARAYALYLVALFALVYLVPVLYTAGTSPALVHVGSPEAVIRSVGALTVAACWLAQLSGRFWGPLVMQPFLLHVFTNTDLSPTAYLGTIARRRMAYAGLGTLLTACVAAYVTTDLFDRSDTALPGLAVAGAASAFVAVAWLWGQVRPVRDNLALGCAAAAAALPLTAMSGAVGLWLAAGALAAAAILLGSAAFRSIRTVDLTRLARESARAAQAQTYATTGTFHHALDLYRPEPRGLTSALIRSDGRLRGHLAQGAVRAWRTPGRALAAVCFLLVGGAVLTLGVAAPESGAASAAWVAGALCVYLGSGWVSETWRGLRDELILPSLLGEWWGGVLARTLAWPVAAVVAGVGVAGALALLWPPGDADSLPTTILLVAASTVLVLAARFLREMKLQLPLELLVPIITPMGDLSALRVLAWQFDGFLALAGGTTVMALAPSALTAAAIALVVASCCIWAGLRRTGWANTGLLNRLSRAGYEARQRPLSSSARSTG